MPRRRADGEGSITWDASVGRWVARLPRDERGRRAKVSGKTKKEALDKLRKRLRERDQGLSATAGQMTVKQYLEGWVRDSLPVMNLAESSKRNHESAVRLHLVPGLGRIKLLKLSPAHVQQFIREELAAGKGARTVQLSHNTLRTALKQAELWGLVPRNVARLVTPPRYSPQERRPFTRDEQLRILAAARDDPLYVLVRPAHASGLRQSELLGLQWRDLDLDEGWVRVSKQLGRDGTLRPLKTAAGRRAVPLPRVMVDLLTGHRTEHEKLRADAIYWEDHGLVFTTKTGRPLSQRNVHRTWARILERAGVEHRGIHHLQHTWITTLAEQGVHERTAQQLAGHADGRMTREIYTHVTDTMLQEAADAIERAVGDTDAAPDDGRGTADTADDCGVEGSSSGSSEGNDPENDEGQEPGYGA